MALEQAGAGEQSAAAGVDQQGAADGVRERLLGLGAAGPEALALAGRRRAERVVEPRPGLEHLLDDAQIVTQPVQSIRRAHVHLHAGTHITPVSLCVKKGKDSPYSIAERTVPELIPVLGSQPAGDVSHKPGGRLPLLSATPAVTLATLKRAATNFAAW